MKFKSEVVTQASGSVGGVTYARNRGGLYRRARSIPVNVNSAAQLAARTNLASLSIAWRESLTQVERDAWSDYAALSPVTDVFGDPILLSGQQMYVRCNSVRLRAGFSRVDSGPQNPGLIDLSPVDASVVIGAGAFNITFDNSDSWANETNGGLAIQTSRFLSPAINFFRGPFRFIDSIDGNPTTAPTSPASVGTANAFGQDVDNGIVGQTVFIRARAFGADGRISDARIVRHTLTEL